MVDGLVPRNVAGAVRLPKLKELDEDALNQSHQIVVVAATLDDSTERIIAYLTERGIAINALLFQVFAN